MLVVDKWAAELLARLPKSKSTGDNSSFFKNPHVMCPSIVTKVCDHRNYCKNDGGALYLGQAHHISYPPHRNINSWFPTGWSSIRSNWNGLCNYAANAHGNHALCNMPTNTHSWRTPAQANPGFVCGKASSETPPSFCPPACLFAWHCPVPDLPVGWECTIRHGM